MASWMRLDTRDVSSFEYDGLDVTAYGLLMLLAWRSWDQGGIPDDKSLVLRALRGRIDGAAFDAAWAQVRPLLDADRDGKLRLPWIEEARVELLEHRKSETERKRDQRLRARQGHLSRGTPPESRGSPVGVPPCPGPTDVRTDVRTKEKRAPRAVAADAALAVPVPAALDTEAFRARWADFLADRKARRKPVTERAARLLLKKLEPWGPSKAIQALGSSIEAGWSGVFEPEANGFAPKGPPAKPAAVIAAERDRAALERDVERRWTERHTVLREVDSPLGGKVKRAVLDGRYPGFEAAQRELAQKASA